MSYGAVRTVAPVEDPVSLAEAKAHLRVTGSDEDSDISDKLAEAIRYVEQQTHRQLVRATWQVKVDRFPTGTRPQRLPLGQLYSVDQITYLGGDGTTYTIDSATIASDYVVTTTREPGYITPAYGVTWPIVRSQRDAVTYTIKAGWADAASVDPLAKAAIKLVLGHLYEHREHSSALTLKEIPIGATQLIEALVYDDFESYLPT